jgi:hypothetical protein
MPLPKWDLMKSPNKMDVKKTIEILDECVDWIINEVENPTFDHNSVKDVRDGYWDFRIDNRKSWLRIAGKLINRYYGYDYIAENFPGVVEWSPKWDSGLADSQYRMCYLTLNKIKDKLQVVKVTR